MDQILQHGLNGVVLGGTYALLGIGLTLIFGIMRVVNFTHGELYAFGAYLAYLFVALLFPEFADLGAGPVDQGAIDILLGFGFIFISGFALVPAAVIVAIT